MVKCRSWPASNRQVQVGFLVGAPFRPRRPIGKGASLLSSRRPFESARGLRSEVAQTAERAPVKRTVAGSNPALGAILALIPKRTRCRIVDPIQAGSSPVDAANLGSRDRAALGRRRGKSGLSAAERRHRLEVTPPVRKDSGANRDAFRGNAVGLRAPRSKQPLHSAKGETAKPGPGSEGVSPARSRRRLRDQRNTVRETESGLRASQKTWDKCYGSTLRSGRSRRGSIPWSQTMRVRCLRPHARLPTGKSEFDSRHPLQRRRGGMYTRSAQNAVSFGT